MKTHLRSVALPSNKLVEVNKREQILAKDLGAYKRLTDDGLEPNRIDGCHKLESTGASAARIEGRPA